MGDDMVDDLDCLSPPPSDDEIETGTKKLKKAAAPKVTGVKRTIHKPSALQTGYFC